MCFKYILSIEVCLFSTSGERECVLDISSGSFSWDEIDDKGECHSKDTGNNQSSTQNTSLVINDSDADHVTSNGDHVTSNGDHVTSVEDDMTGVLKLHGINLHVKQVLLIYFISGNKQFLIIYIYRS